MSTKRTGKRYMVLEHDCLRLSRMIAPSPYVMKHNSEFKGWTIVVIIPLE